MSHIVILGAGLDGLPAAYDLLAALDKRHQVILVNANAFFQFVPSNPWVAVGWHTREQITFELEPFFKKERHQLHSPYIPRKPIPNRYLLP